MVNYKPRFASDMDVDPSRCLEAVQNAIGFHQCTRKAVVGDRCRQHSPEAKKKRAAASDAKVNEELLAMKRRRTRHAALVECAEAARRYREEQTNPVKDYVLVTDCRKHLFAALARLDEVEGEK